MNYLYSILTCNFGGYEILKEVENPRPDVEYVYVTDDETLTSSTWKIVIVKDKHFLDIKHDPFTYITSDVCVWMDGSYKILKDFTDNLVSPFIASDKQMMISLHESCSNVFQEVVRWMYWRGLSPKNADAMFQNLLRYSECDFNTLFQTSFWIMKKTSETETMLERWREVQTVMSVDGYYRDDQTTFSFLSCVLFYDWDKFEFLNFESVSDNEYFKWCLHGTDKCHGDVAQRNFLAFGQKRDLKCIE